MAKRKRPVNSSRLVKKRHKSEPQLSVRATSRGEHAVPAVLNNCYREVKTLRNYLLDALPTTSNVRRKRILASGDESQEHSILLNHTLVGLFEAPPTSVLVERQEQLLSFTQTCRATQPYSATTQQCTLDEVSHMRYS